MNASTSNILLVGALILGWALPQAVGAGELSVTRQKDGTLLITNTGLPPPGPMVPAVDEGVTVKKVSPVAVPEAVPGMGSAVKASGADGNGDSVASGNPDTPGAPRESAGSGQAD